MFSDVVKFERDGVWRMTCRSMVLRVCFNKLKMKCMKIGRQQICIERGTGKLGGVFMIKFIG